MQQIVGAVRLGGGLIQSGENDLEHTRVFAALKRANGGGGVVLDSLRGAPHGR